MSDFIKWDNLDTRRNSGVEKIFCPKCHDSRKDKKDKSMSVDHDTGIAKCFNAGCDFICVKGAFNEKSSKYKTPDQEWKNYTNISDDNVKYLKSRGFSQENINHHKITEEKYYQPKESKNTNNIVFNYFEGEKLINKKYRSYNKSFTQFKGAKKVFFGLNDIINQKEIYIVEGEFDKMALYEIGVKNCISLPDGANDNDKVWINCEKYLKNINTFYIATDNDDAGNDVADKIAQRLGKHRCKRVLFKNKDANDDLKESPFVLEESLKNIKDYPVSGLLEISSLEDEILYLYDNGIPETIAPKRFGLDLLAEIFSVMMGQLTVITGIPSHGKSTFIEWYLLNMIIEYGFKFSYFSPEHNPTALHQTVFINRFFGKPFFKNKKNTSNRVSRDQVKDYLNWVNNKIYVTNFDPNLGIPLSWDFILTTFKQQIYSRGINVFLIDSFNKVPLGKGNKKDNIDEVLTMLTAFCIQHNVMIFLVAHPTKMNVDDQTGLYKIPTLYDVSGSADFRNQTHNGLCVYRYFDEESKEDYTVLKNLKTKFSFQGDIGKQVAINYDVVSQRYYKGQLYGGDRSPLVDLNSYVDDKNLIQSSVCPF